MSGVYIVSIKTAKTLMLTVVVPRELAKGMTLSCFNYKGHYCLELSVVSSKRKGIMPAESGYGNSETKGQIILRTFSR